MADVTLLEMHFDGDANDSSGNGLHGTWNGTARYTTGVPGQAIDLPDGSYVAVGHDDLLGGMAQVTIDVDLNGTIDIIDALLIAQYSVRLVPALPSPD